MSTNLEYHSVDSNSAENTESIKAERKNNVIDLEKYEKKLLKAIKENSSDIFTNADEEHAAIAFSVLFKNTNNSLKIIAESFSGDISNDDKYVEALEQCLNKPGLKAEVLVLKTPNIKSRGYKALLKAKKELRNVEIKTASEKSIAAIKQGMTKSLLSFGETHNMSIFDDKMYRLEYLPSQYTAFLAFNDKTLAKDYTITFTAAFSTGIPISE